jgi:hypothetical protein
MQMYQAMKGEGNLALAASYLLKGMMRCSLSNDDNITFIVEASKTLGKLKLGMTEGMSNVVNKVCVYHKVYLL